MPRQRTKTVDLLVPLSAPDLEANVTATVSIVSGYSGCFGGPPDAWQPPEPTEGEVTRATIDLGPLGTVDLDPALIQDYLESLGDSWIAEAEELINDREEY